VKLFQMMSLVVYHETVNQIELAFNEKNKPKIDKDTFYILCQLIVSMQGIFKDRLQSVSIDPISLQFDEAFITSDENRKALLSWLKRLKGMDYSMDDYEFGKLKVDLEEWFYRIGGRDIQFEYRESFYSN